MFNIGQMMKQVQEMQGKMGDMQSRLADMEVTGQAGGGMVTILMNGKGEAKKTTIDPKLGTGDIDMLEDLVTAAINDAKAKVDALAAEESEKIMGGLKLPPGVKLPF